MTGSDKSRVVLLTGAAGGLGIVMTTALLEAGHAVVAADRNTAALEKLSAVAAPHRDRFLPLATDVAIAAQCEAAVAKTIAHFGRIEGIVNNAGIGPS